MIEQSQDIERLFEPGREETLDAYLRLLHAVDIAELFNHVDVRYWKRLTSCLDAEKLADTLSQLDDGVQEKLGSLLKIERLAAAVEELETDDAADLLGELSPERASAVLAQLDEDDRDDIQTLLSFPEDSAGGLMQTELCMVEEGLLVSDAIEAVRLAREEIEEIHEVYLVNSEGMLRGIIQLEDLVLSTGQTNLGEISQPVEQRVTVDLDQEEVARVFGKYDLVSLPVVDPQGLLVGRITFDDIHDVMLEEATEDVMTMAGASSVELVYGQDFFRIAMFRLPWLVGSLFGSLIAAVLVPMFRHVPFEDTLMLAAFVPVVAAMTGNVGSQTAMIITRGFAIGKVDTGMLGKTLARESMVGSIMGLAAGVLVALVSNFGFGSYILGITVGLSMFCSMTIAAFVGALAPAMFKEIGIDPAIAAGPLVTTGCDVMGVAIYLGAARLILG